MSEEKMTGRLPQFIRRDVERAIEAAINPRGMSVHDGKASIGADRLQYMLALIDQTMKSENSSAKQKYDELMKDCEETSPIERLRFYCSLAMSGQDWLDAEPFINALAPPSAQAIETAAIMKCVEICRAEFNHTAANKILALIPQDGRTQLEEFGMKVAQEVKSATVYNECRNMLTKENELRAIVANLIGEKK